MSEVIDTAVLLVAGVGSRLRPLTDEVPKALVPVGRYSMLERAVSTLREHGVRHFVFATGYRQDAVRTHVESLGVRAQFSLNPRYEETQNAISLLHCRSALQGVGFYKLDGDVLFDREILARLDSSGAQLDVAVDGVRPLDAEAMKVVVDKRRNIVRFGKAIPVADAHGESIGIERLESAAAAAVFDAIAALEHRGVVDRYYEDVYSELIALGQIQANAVEVGDLRWTEVDDHVDLARAAVMFP